MEIRCKATKRFLLNLKIEEYHKLIKKLGLNLQVPLILEIPCSNCKMVEVYEIYENHYKHTKSYRFDNKK